MGILLDILKSPYRLCKKTLEYSFGVKEQREAYRELKEQGKRLHKQYDDLKNRNRDPDAPGAPDMSDFDQVMKHWEITEAELPKVIQGMIIQIVMFGIIGFWGLFLVIFSSSWLVKFQGGMLFATGVVVDVCRIWRVQILKNREFVFFRDWSFIRFFKKKEDD